MQIGQSKSNLIFVVKNLLSSEGETVYAQRKTLYSTQYPNEELSTDLIEPAEQLSALPQLVKELHEVEVWPGQQEILVFSEGWIDAGYGTSMSW